MSHAPDTTTTAESAPPSRKTVRRVVSASVIGTTIETYDLFIYGTAAALVFPTVFFSDMDPTTALIFSFLTFAASFLARPIGAIVLGHYGDLIGRKKVLIFSLLLMGVATFLIAFLPGYDVWGPAAPIILVVLRICQGVGFGGEWSGAITMVNEYASPSKRALFSSFPQVGSPLGLITANLMFLIITAVVPDDAFLEWGWRIPFLFSIVLVILGFWLRRQIDETPQFKKIEQQGRTADAPLLEVLKRPMGFILVAASSTSLFGTYYIVTTYMLSALTNQLDVPRAVALTCLLIAAGFQALTIPVFGWLAGRVRPGILMISSVVGIALWAVPLVLLTGSGTPALIGVGFAVYMILQTMFYGPMGSAFPALFDTRFRYTGLGMGLNIGGLLGGGIAPLIAAGIPFGTGIAVLMIVLCAFSFPFTVGVLVRMTREKHTARGAQHDG